MTGQIIFAWLALASGWTLALFGYDKWQAGRGGARIAESTLLLASALGGWPGGLAGMLLFRHKTVKTSFVIKYVLVLPVWAALIAGALRLAGWL
jgi:uncharacterized membrane protein YsdA (DUF1294 family)